MQNHNVNFSMIENASDFIESGLNSVLANDYKEHKYAIIHLHAGITLFLKDVLSKEHWSLIFQNVDNANKEDLISGDVQTVNYKTLKSRLNKITDFNINEIFFDSLDFINRTRNNIEHYHFNINTYQLKSRLAQLIHGLINFLNQIYQIDNNYLILLKMVRKYSLQYDSYHDERYKIIQPKLNNVCNLFECKKCKQKTVELSKERETAFCYFCDSELSSRELEELITDATFLFEYQNNIEANHNCPNCSNDTLYEKNVLPYDIYSNWICFNCFESYDSGDIDQCVDCGNTVHTENDILICNSCLDDKLNK